MGNPIKCPWCEVFQFDSYEEIEECTTILLRKPYIIQCDSCDGFYRIKKRTEISRMKLVKVGK